MAEFESKNISLESNIDAKAMDTLVPIDTPMLQHNRQRFQGRYLPTSLRFEHDGWAAGNDVYNFDITEVAIALGKYTAVKSAINKNPTYKISLCIDDRQIGYFYYIPESTIKSSSVSDVELSDSTDTIIAGSMNGKQVKLSYDASKGTLLNMSHSDIEMLEHELTTSYVHNITLRDKSATISLDVGVLVKPTTNVYNDKYLLGTFSGYADGVATWQNKHTSFEIDTLNNKCSIYRDGVLSSEHSISISSDGDVSIGFYDNIKLPLVMHLFFSDIIPLFEAVSVKTVSPTISGQADDTFILNKHVLEVSAYDTGYNADKLYRCDDKYSYFHLKQRVPVWYGFCVAPKAPALRTPTYDTGYKIPMYIKEKDTHKYCNSYNVHDPNNGNGIEFWFEASNEFNAYDESDFVDISIWEGTKRTIIYSRELSVQPKLFELAFKVTVMNFVSHFATVEGTLQVSSMWHDFANVLRTFRYSRNNSNSQKMTATVEFTNLNEAIEISKLSTTISVSDFRPLSKWLYSGYFKISFYNGQASILPYNIVLVGTTVKQDNKYVAALEADSSKSPTGIAFFAACVWQTVESRFFLSDGKGLLPTSIDKSYFTLENYSSNTDFYHMLGSCAMQGNQLKVNIYLCSANEANYLFYVPSGSTTSTSSDNNDESRYKPSTTNDKYTGTFAPSHIMYNDIAYLDNHSSEGFGGLKGLKVNTIYSETSVDIDYGLTLQLSANAVTDTDGNYYKVITSAELSDTRLPKFDTTDIFRDKYYNKLISSLSVSVDDPVLKVALVDSSNTLDYIVKAQQLLHLHYAGLDETIAYGLCGELGNITREGNIYELFRYTLQTLSTGAGNVSIDMSLAVPYSVTARVPRAPAGYVLDSFENNIAVIHSGRYRLMIDYSSKQVTLQEKEGDVYSDPVECDELWNAGSVHLTSEYVRKMSLVLKGVYAAHGLIVEGIHTSDTTDVLLKVGDESIAVPIERLLNSNEKSTMEFLYTKVDNEELTKEAFAKVNTEEEFQLIKQQWNTTEEVENFWWIDDTHILLLTKTCLILKEKTSVLTDWDGDKFDVVYSFKRTDYITSDVVKYLCSSAKDNSAYLILISVPDSDSVQLCVYNPLDYNDKGLRNSQKVTLHFKHIELGKKLNADAKNLNTYANVPISYVMSFADISATHVGKHLLIGIHYDNNFNQWAIVLDDTTMKVSSVIQGYGYVGVDGTLTGGEIPAAWFDVKCGFNGIVLPLDKLNDTNSEISRTSELFTLESRVVGNDSQQWYISKSIDYIVSHITYAAGQFIAHKLPLNNNYAVGYGSGSYKVTLRSDFNLSVQSFKSLFDSGTWTAMMVLFGYPMAYYFAPKITVANYLQQSLGQAAYVHYNSTSIHQSKDLRKESVLNNYSKEEAEEAVDKWKEESAVSSDEITFDRQTVKQVQSTSNPFSTLFTMLAAAKISLLELGVSTLEQGANKKQISLKETMKNATTYAAQNFLSMSAADMSVRSLTPSHTSEVTAIKSLDMFYSTSDNQKICAGRGYVNHNFVAQCVSQSVTSMQGTFYQQKLFYILKQLTLFPIQQANKGLKLLEFTQQDIITAFGGSESGGFVVSYTGPIKIAAIAAVAAARAGCVATDIALELLPELLSAMGGDTVNTSITSYLPKCKYDIEAKHKYGSKTECFMYPCFGISEAQTVNDEGVAIDMQNKAWKLGIDVGKVGVTVDDAQPDFVTSTPSKDVKNFDGDVDYFISTIKGMHAKRKLPDRMACVEGVDSFLPDVSYKNEYIGESEPVFATPPFQDYIIDETWQLSQTASVGMTTWLSVKDTKIIDGDYSNIVISNDFCGVASPYTAIEVKRGIDKRYLRPYAVTAQALALNQTGLNCCFEERAYHAFDGYGYRVVRWIGEPGMNKEHRTWLYSFLQNDRFKRGNKMPLNEYLGNFKCDPEIAMLGDYNDKPITLITQPGEGVGLQAGVTGEDKDVRRYAIPVFTEELSIMPAAVKTLDAQILSVIDGVTSLTTENRNLQSQYKAPLSIDFNISRSRYRYTQEYICSLTQERGVVTTKDVVPCLGLTFLGATPDMAYLYSQATRQYYTFTGGTSLQLVDSITRFRDVLQSSYDFIHQEVLLVSRSTFNRLDKQVHDDADETDNTLVLCLKNNGFVDEVCPPLETIYNTTSDFKIRSLACGIVYQGPNRCILNRYVLQDYMVKQIKANYGKWKRVPREAYHPFRVYKDKYSTVDTLIGSTIEVNGWTHNPFLFVTSPLGIDERTDCKFEWEITFYWSVDMDKLYNTKQYATVNILAETMTEGGKVIPERPAHVFLTKELFTRTNNYGYYTFRYQSNNGAGNRERLHIWSDQYICISSITLKYAALTSKRTEQLTIQPDVQYLEEI